MAVNLDDTRLWSVPFNLEGGIDRRQITLGKYDIHHRSPDGMDKAISCRSGRDKLCKLLHRRGDSFGWTVRAWPNALFATSGTVPRADPCWPQVLFCQSWLEVSRSRKRIGT